MSNDTETKSLTLNRTEGRDLDVNENNAIAVKPGLTVDKDQLALSPQLVEIANLVGGVENIPDHDGGTGSCSEDCERCHLVSRVEGRALLKDKDELFGDWGGSGVGW